MQFLEEFTKNCTDTSNNSRENCRGTRRNFGNIWDALENLSRCVSRHYLAVYIRATSGLLFDRYRKGSQFAHQMRGSIKKGRMMKF